MRRRLLPLFTVLFPSLVMVTAPVRADTLTITVRVHVPPTCRSVADGSVQCNDARLTPVIRRMTSIVEPQGTTAPNPAIVTFSIVP